MVTPPVTSTVSTGANATYRVSPVMSSPGAVGVARSELTPEGTVFVQGEIWTAESVDGPIPAGGRVRVTRVDGLRLRVKKEEASA